MKSLSLLIFISGFTFAQKIKVSEIDPFNNKRKIETSFEKLTSSSLMAGMGTGKTAFIAFLEENDRQFLRIKWTTNELLAIDKNAPIILLDSEGISHTYKSSELSIAGIGAGATGMFGIQLFGLDLYAEGNLAELDGKKITDIRLHTIEGYVDLKVEKKRQEVVAKTYLIFKEEQSKR